MISAKKRVRLGEKPPTVAGVVDCNICGFKADNPMGLNRLRPKDFVSIQGECDDKTSERKKTTARWNSCCGSFKEYQVLLIKDIYGKSYAITEEIEDDGSKPSA